MFVLRVELSSGQQVVETNLSLHLASLASLQWRQIKC